MSTNSASVAGGCYAHGVLADEPLGTSLARDVAVITNQAGQLIKDRVQGASPAEVLQALLPLAAAPATRGGAAAHSRATTWPGGDDHHRAAPHDQWNDHAWSRGWHESEWHQWRGTQSEWNRPPSCTEETHRAHGYARSTLAADIPPKPADDGTGSWILS